MEYWWQATPGNFTVKIPQRNLRGINRKRYGFGYAVSCFIYSFDVLELCLVITGVCSLFIQTKNKK